MIRGSAVAVSAMCLFAIAGISTAHALLAREPQPAYAKLALVRRAGATARYLRLQYDLTFSGVRGTEAGLYDLQSPRYVERISAGPLSSSSGFDGKRFWGADSTGLALVEDRAYDVAGDAAFADLFSEKKALSPEVTVLSGTPRERVLRLAFAHVLEPIDVSVDRRTGLIAEIVNRDQLEPERSRYGGYRLVRGFELPFTQVTTSRLDTTIEHVRSVQPLRSVPAGAFAIPPAPRDVSLQAPAALPLIVRDGSPYVAVSVNGKPPLYLMFDSGGSNSLSPRAASVLSLHPFGSYRTGGVGAGLEPTRRVLAKIVRAGGALLTNQPFDVERQSGDDDGTIGCEFMERFVVQIDYRRKTLTLARSAAQLHHPGASIPITSFGCEPEINGAFDGYRGAFGLDTGSFTALDIMGPIVRREHLLERYGVVAHIDGGGYGGEVRAAVGKAKHVEFGGFDLSDVPIHLSAMSQGAFADPSEIGNVGAGILERFIVTIDLPRRRLWLEPQGDAPPMR